MSKLQPCAILQGIIFKMVFDCGISMGYLSKLLPNTLPPCYKSIPLKNLEYPRPRYKSIHQNGVVDLCRGISLSILLSIMILPLSNLQTLKKKREKVIWSWWCSQVQYAPLILCTISHLSTKTRLFHEVDPIFLQQCKIYPSIYLSVPPKNLIIHSKYANLTEFEI